MVIKNCRFCGSALTDKNWIPGYKRSGYLCCRLCKNNLKKQKELVEQGKKVRDLCKEIQEENDGSYTLPKRGEHGQNQKGEGGRALRYKITRKDKRVLDLLRRDAELRSKYPELLPHLNFKILLEEIGLDHTQAICKFWHAQVNPEDALIWRS